MLYLLPLALCGLDAGSGAVLVVGDAKGVQLRKQIRVLDGR